MASMSQDMAWAAWHVVHRAHAILAQQLGRSRQASVGDPRQIVQGQAPAMPRTAMNLRAMCRRIATRQLIPQADSIPWQC